MTLVAMTEHEGLARARAQRGPWWWRLRCWAAARLLAVATAVDPDDRSSMSWYSDDNTSVYFAQVRRPK